MKTSVLKSKLKSMALNEMPEVIDKIDLAKVHILPKEERTPGLLRNLRRVLTYTFTFLFIGVLSVGGYTLFIGGPTTTTPFQTDTEILAFQTISASSLQTDIDASPLSFEVTPYALDTTAGLEDDIDLINQYLNMMETVLGDQDTMLTQSLESDKIEYQYYILYRNQDCLGNLIEYKFYYNVSESGDTAEITGMLYHEENAFEISAAYSGDSTSNMESLRASLSESRYVLVEDQSTEDAQSYKYMQYVDNQLQNEAVVSVMMKNGSLKSSIALSGNASLFLNVERVKNANGDSFNVEYSINNNGNIEQGQFQVKIESEGTTGASIYKYTVNHNGMQSEMTGKRENKGNTLATEDDFVPMGNHGNNSNTTTTTVLTTSQTTTNSGSNTQTTATTTDNTNHQTTTSNMGSNPH
ncbi:MAG: hypothetical protein KKE16_04190 [Firmicutes bacterium]|nr:hypothetical protein [Bacillota bacterium]